MARGDVFDLSFDSDGLHFSFNLDDVRGRGHSIELDGQVRCVLGYSEAAELHRKVNALIGPWVAEHDRERAAYDRATPAERADVLGHDDGETGYALDDPKSPGYHDRMAGVFDMRRDLGRAPTAEEFRQSRGHDR